MTGTARILVVEDNRLNMKLARDVLEHAGYEVVEATTGEDGVRLALDLVPDLVLMDLQLPGIDGTEALRRIRREVERPVAIVAVTASAMPADREEAAEAGFDGFLEKPIDIRTFPAQVAAFLARSP